jgi:hypothetical protein
MRGTVAPGVSLAGDLVLIVGRVRNTPSAACAVFLASVQRDSGEAIHRQQSIQ